MLSGGLKRTWGGAACYASPLTLTSLRDTRGGLATTPLCVHSCSEPLLRLRPRLSGQAKTP
jgi:hypothetical protein